jgi:integrase
MDLGKIAKREAVPLTLRELCQLYTTKNANERDMEMHLRKWLDDFGLAERSAWSITTEELVNGYTAMTEDMGYAQATANRDLSGFGTLFIFAHDQKLCAADFVSPTLAIRRKTCDIRYVEPAKPGEWDLMRRTARLCGDALFTAFVWLIMDSGARRSEITDRRWDEFHLDAAEGPHIVLLDTKTDKPRRIYFSQDTAALIRRLRPTERYRHELAFAGRGGVPRTFQQAWKRYAERIGRPGLHVHDLRHMVAAELLKAGKGMSQVASLLGHSTLVLHTRYGHLDDAGVRNMQAERLGLDVLPAPEFPPVAEARRRQAERDASAPGEAAAEAQRLHLIAQEAMAAAMAAAQALASMRNGATTGVQA